MTKGHGGKWARLGWSQDLGGGSWQPSLWSEDPAHRLTLPPHLEGEAPDWEGAARPAARSPQV